MLDVLPETKMILKQCGEGRPIRTFAHFDFRFHPVRAHDGDVPIELEGHTWSAIGPVLRENFRIQNFSLSRRGQTDGIAKVSLPMMTTPDIQDVISKKYYRNRSLTVMLYVKRPNGSLVEKVQSWKGIIREYSEKEDVVTFTAKDVTFASQAELDEWHKNEVGEVRRRFSTEFVGGLIKDAVGIVSDVFSGRIENLLQNLGSLSNLAFFRDIRQRWEARRRRYCFDGFLLPSASFWRFGRHRTKFVVHADSEQDARAKLVGFLRKNIWRFPIGIVSLPIRLNGRLDRLYNLDVIRESADKAKWDSVKQEREWGDGNW